MFCQKCGNQLNDGASFCPKCGAKVEAQKTVEQTSPTASLETVKTATGKKFIAIAGVAALVLILVIVGVSGTGVKRMDSKIANLTTDIPANAEAIVELYEEYQKLSVSKQNKLENRAALESAYEQAVAYVEMRQEMAAAVDALIAQIDTGNPYAMASMAKSIAGTYEQLDDYTRAYLQNEDKWNKIYDEVKDFSATVTAENFYQLYTLRYRVGDSVDIADSPDYADIAIPVYVDVIPNYQNLMNECSFYINLHQTYSGLGFISSDVYEYHSQSRTIAYDSSQGMEGCAYIIYVNNMETNGGVLDNLFEFHDVFHTMNDFDESRVEITKVTGSVKY